MTDEIKKIDPTEKLDEIPKASPMKKNKKLQLVLRISLGVFGLVALVILVLGILLLPLRGVFLLPFIPI